MKMLLKVARWLITVAERGVLRRRHSMKLLRARREITIVLEEWDEPWKI